MIHVSPAELLCQDKNVDSAFWVSMRDSDGVESSSSAEPKLKQEVLSISVPGLG